MDWLWRDVPANRHSEKVVCCSIVIRRRDVPYISGMDMFLVELTV